MLLWAVVFFVVLAAAIVFALRGRHGEGPAAAPVESWTHSAGPEFATLSEAGRCDLIFAVAALDDRPSQALLERALDDPSETVALAAARALVRRGRAAAVEEYLASHPGERAQRIARLVELLA
jgi:hypothetical protein